MYKVCEITTIVQDHVEWTIWELDCLLNTPVILIIRLPFPGIDGHASLGDGCSSKVLGGEYVAARPLNLLRKKFSSLITKTVQEKQ
jgi:hypothetical protein